MSTQINFQERESEKTIPLTQMKIGQFGIVRTDKQLYLIFCSYCAKEVSSKEYVCIHPYPGTVFHYPDEYNVRVIEEVNIEEV